MLKIIETPRDGIQGLRQFIQTKKKVDYINALLRVGFDTLEVGSFVSSKAIPQLKDTDTVLRKIDLSDSHTKVMVLVGNTDGVQEAVKFDAIDHISFPFSISETFLIKNIRKNLNESFDMIKKMMDLSLQAGKEMIIYISMGFGNPYGDPWNYDLLERWVKKLFDIGLRIIPVSDITGESNPQQISEVYGRLIKDFPKVEFGFHLHATSNDWYAKTDAAYKAGCRRFDTVVGGLGGCPMTGKEMLSNLDTFDLLHYFEEKEIPFFIDKEKLYQAARIANEIKQYE
ncbi:MAG: hypothetical protein K9G67_11260 [Bacteroidales bacterium]|nr:hypothetical protein [Bacteroidales bacterium]MCF8343966.1 hypothetical protein [Bacteroidales bacterium]MCF8350903.1 hypothetical protein [Bacteroidales bacterium]MCF8376925.1 hypothetical protein [Bacteroidales bacterium]MCF8400806.1 hypothetical protein [Bacteroidales bacterium]